MKVVLVASEVAPFSKTGGLADVTGSLPRALHKLGIDALVITPFYRCVRDNVERLGLELHREGAEIRVPMGDWESGGAILRSELPDSAVPVYLLDSPGYYDRVGLYNRPQDGSEHEDNSERFIFLCRGALELCLELGIAPDVFHCHDWQTGPLPVYLKTLYRDRLPDTASLFTVHNIEYQGIFWHGDMKLTGLDSALFNWRMLEYYGNLSFLKAGLVGGDVLTTVSKKYAEEIQTDEYGAGLEGVVRERADDLFGIVNGVDYGVWNPETDQAIPVNYSQDDLCGKAACKQALQEEFGLPQRDDVPLVGMISRLVGQKGFDLLATAMPELMTKEIQFAILGTGEARYHEFLSGLRAKYPDKVGVMLSFSEQAAHRVEAGSDMFLMPSRYEPCGLNQLYSLKYGTVPIVRATGGLADTVIDYGQSKGSNREANGFVFERYAKGALLDAVNRALKLYANSEEWHKLRLAGMPQDWSWDRSAREYCEAYKRACERSRERFVAENGSVFCDRRQELPGDQANV